MKPPCWTTLPAHSPRMPLIGGGWRKDRLLKTLLTFEVENLFVKGNEAHYLARFSYKLISDLKEEGHIFVLAPFDPQGLFIYFQILNDDIKDVNERPYMSIKLRAK